MCCNKHACSVGLHIVAVFVSIYILRNYKQAVNIFYLTILCLYRLVFYRKLLQQTRATSHVSMGGICTEIFGSTCFSVCLCRSNHDIKNTVSDILHQTHRKKHVFSNKKTSKKWTLNS